MTLRLSVDADAWRSHVAAAAKAVTVGARADTANEGNALLPVVKGNGYGFGRGVLMSHAATLSRDVAVGTMHELHDVPDNLRPFVLTPLGAGLADARPSIAIRADAVLAVGAPHDLNVLETLGSRHAVVIKVESSMHRYGVKPSDAVALRKQAESAGHEVIAWSVHLPLAGNDEERVREVISLAGELSADLPLHVSHIGAAAGALRAAVKQHVVVRTGTHLWLGDKSMLALHADVIAVRTATAQHAGYRATSVNSGSRLVMVGCGSSHGVGALDDGHSPFHFAKRRLPMLEAPHMHTTMLTVDDDPCPQEGDWVDVQQPLTRVQPDTIAWN